MDIIFNYIRVDTFWKILLFVHFLMAVSLLARIIHHLLIFCGGCSAKWPIHIANRCLVELLRATAERHNRHDRRYSASL